MDVFLTQLLKSPISSELGVVYRDFLDPKKINLQNQDPKIFCQYVENYWKQDHNIPQIMKTTSSVLSFLTDNALEKFIGILPVLDDGSEKPKTTHKLTFTDCSMGLKWENKMLRDATFFFDNFLISTVLEQLVTENKINGKNTELVLSSILSIFAKYPNGDINIKTISAKFFAKSICRISEIYPGVVLSFAINSIHNSNSNNDFCTAFTLFSEMFINKELDLLSFNIENHISFVAKKIQNSAVSTQIPKYGTIYLTNLLGCLFTREIFRSGSLIQKIHDLFKTLMKDQKLNEYHRLHSLVYSFSNHSKMKRTPLEYFREYITKTHVKEVDIDVPLSKNILMFLIAYIGGEEYAPDTIAKMRGVRYFMKPRPDKYTPALKDMMIDLIVNKPKLFKAAFEETVELFLLLASRDTNFFFIEILPRIRENKFSDENQESIITALGSMIIPASNFPVNNDKIATIYYELFQLLKKIIANGSTNCSSNNNNFAICIPFQKTLEKYDNYTIACFNIFEDSYPINDYNLDIAKSKTRIIRWKSSYRIDPNFPINKETTFQNSIPDESKDNSILIKAIGTVSFFNKEIAKPQYLEIIKSISLCINSSSLNVSSISMRTCQALCMISKELFENVLLFLTQNPTSAKGFCHPNLYRTLYLMNYILKEFCNLYSISHGLAVAIDRIVLLSLCSSLSSCREYGLLIMDQLNDTSAIMDIIKNNNDTIMEQSIKAGLSMIKPGFHIQNEMYKDLSIRIVVSSPCITLYFYVAAMLGFHISQTKFSLEYTDYLYKMISNSQNCGVDTESLALMMIFCLNMSSDNMIFDMIWKKSKLINSKNCDFELVKHYYSVILLNPSSNYYPIFCEQSIFTLYSVAYSLYCNHVVFKNEYDFQIIFDVYLSIINNLFNFGSKVEHYRILYGNQSQEEQMFMHLLMSFLLLSDHLFLSYYDSHQESSNGLFLLKPVCMTSPYNNDDLYVIFKLLIGISEDIKSLSQLSLKSLSSLINISSISSELYASIRDKVGVLYPPLLSSLLSFDFVNLLPIYIDLASSDDKNRAFYFMAISDQFLPFVDDKTFLENLKKRSEKRVLHNENDVYTAIYKVTGKLLSLSLVYLVSEQVKKQAITLLANVAISVLSIRDSPKLFQDTLSIINVCQSEFFSLLSNLNLSSAIQLSFNLSRTHFFCAEQFVFSLFQMFKCFPKELASLALPWISRIRISHSNLPVFSDCDPIFLSFSSNSFLSSLLSIPLSEYSFSIIDKVINEQTHDSLSIHKYFVTYICLNGFLDTNISHNSHVILMYLLSQRPMETGRILIRFLKFSTWFYFNVQLNDFIPDFELSLNNNHSINSIETNYCRLHEEISPDEIYQKICIFILQVFSDVSKSKSFNLDEIFPEIVAFSLINVGEIDNDLLEPFIRTIHDFQSNQLNEVSFRLYLNSLGENIISQFGTECLMWGLCCGQIELATKSLKIFSHILYPQNNLVFKTLVKCLRIVSIQLYEATNKKAGLKKSIQQLSSISSGYESIEPIVQYLETIIKLLARLVPFSDTHQAELFYIGCSFLQCIDLTYRKLLHPSLDLMLKCLQHDLTSKALSSGKNKPPHYIGIVELLTSTIHDTNMYNLCHEFYLEILKTNNYSLVFKGNPGKAITYVITNAFKLGFDRSIYQLMDEFLGKSEFLLLVKQVCALLNKSPSENILNVLQFFIGYLEQPKNIDPNVFAQLALFCSRNSYAGNAIHCYHLLSVLNELGTQIPEPINVDRKQSFPLIMFASDLIMNNSFYYPDETKFTNLEQIPPLYIQSDLFLNSPHSLAMWPKIKSIKSMPLTEWESTLVTIQNIQMYKLSTDYAIFYPNPKEFINQLQNYVSVGFDRIGMSNKVLKKRNMNDKQKVDDNIVNPIQFIPSLN